MGIQIFLAFIGGAGAATIIGAIIGFLINHKKLERQKERELSTKTIGLVISETSGLFSSFRLGELSFPDFERKVRDMISKIDEEVNDNLSVLDNCYVTLLSRYAEDKRESLLALRESLAARSPIQQQQYQPQVQQQVQQQQFQPQVQQQVQQQQFQPQVQQQVQQQQFQQQRAPQQQVQQPVQPAKQPSQQKPIAQAAAIAAPITVAAAAAAAGFDDFADFASSMEETAANSHALFGGVEQTIVQESPRHVIDPSFAAEQTVTTQVPQFNQPTQQIFTPPQTQQQTFDSMLDVEATQEFNMNDIMNSASAQNTPQHGMISGDDVANKLDALFG